jgi:hypothetical protein
VLSYIRVNLTYGRRDAKSQLCSCIAIFVINLLGRPDFAKSAFYIATETYPATPSTFNDALLSRYVNAKAFTLNIHCNYAVGTPAEYRAGKHQVSLVEVTANALLHAFIPTTRVAAAQYAGVGVVQTIFNVFKRFHGGSRTILWRRCTTLHCEYHLIWLSQVQMEYLRSLLELVC